MSLYGGWIDFEIDLRFCLTNLLLTLRGHDVKLVKPEYMKQLWIGTDGRLAFITSMSAHILLNDIDAECQTQIQPLQHANIYIN